MIVDDVKVIDERVPSPPGPHSNVGMGWVRYLRHSYLNIETGTGYKDNCSAAGWGVCGNVKFLNRGEVSNM